MATDKIYTVAKVTTARPSMFTPSITIAGEKITVKDEFNGNFLGGYRIYANGQYIATKGPEKSIDLGTVRFPDVSTYEIKIRAYSDYFNDSPDSNSVSFTMKGYDIIDNELGQTAIIMSNYRMEPNPKKKSGLICIMF